MGTANLLGEPNKYWPGVTCNGLASRPGGVEILLATSCYRNGDKLQQLRFSYGSKASLLLFQYRLRTIKEKPLTGTEVLRLNGEIRMSIFGPGHSAQTEKKSKAQEEQEVFHGFRVRQHSQKSDAQLWLILNKYSLRQERPSLRWV